MKMESPNGAQQAATLESVLKELRRLNERVSALETNAVQQRPVTAASAPVLVEPTQAAAEEEEELSEELVIVIGAAVAAYLGKKAHLRQVRLVGSVPWAQQGRVTVQASHTLEGRRPL